MSAIPSTPISTPVTCVDTTASARLFYERLKALEPAAIRQLHANIFPIVHRIGKRNQCSQEDIEEIVDDALLICLEKLRTGTFVFQDVDSTVYAIGIAKKLLQNLCRKRKIVFKSLDNFPEPADFDATHFMESKEQEKILCYCLEQLPQPCNQVIRLRYYDSYSDQEVVEQQLTGYATVNSLKNKRKICLKYLRKKIERFRIQFMNS